MKVHKGKEFLWVEDDDGRGGFIAAEGEKTFLVLEDKDMFIARKMPRRNLGFGKRKGKGEPRSKSSLSERARPTEGRVWPTKTGIPTTRHTRERRERTIEIPYPFDGPSYDNGTGKGGKGVAETPGFSPLKRVTKIKICHGLGVRQAGTSHETPGENDSATIASHDAFQHQDTDAAPKKLARADTVSLWVYGQLACNATRDLHRPPNQ